MVGWAGASVGLNGHSKPIGVPRALESSGDVRIALLARVPSTRQSKTALLATFPTVQKSCATSRISHAS